MKNKTALLIIDAQVNMFADEHPVFEAGAMLHKLGSLVARARRAKVPVVYVQNNGSEMDPDVPDTPGWQIHPMLTPGKGEIVIQKWEPDSFKDTELQKELEKLGVGRLVIAGMQTEYCVNATTRRAQELGYEVTLVKDAHSTYDSGGMSAAQIIANHNRELGEVVKLEEFMNVEFE